MTINGKNFYDQPIDSDIQRYEEIRKLLLVNMINMIWFNKENELDADPKAIQQIEFTGQLKN